MGDLTPQRIDDLMESLKSKFGAEGAYEFMSQVAQEAAKRHCELQDASDGPPFIVNVYRVADSILETIGDSLPAIENRRHVVAATILDGVQHGLFDDTAKVIFPEEN
jgi:hypothetical protein